jgi:hypothetical protein
MPQLSPDDLTAWQNHLRALAPGDYSLTVDVASQLPEALIHLVKYIAGGEPPYTYNPESPSTECLILTREDLLSAINGFSMYVLTFF